MLTSEQAHIKYGSAGEMYSQPVSGEGGELWKGSRALRCEIWPLSTVQDTGRLVCSRSGFWDAEGCALETGSPGWMENLSADGLWVTQTKVWCQALKHKMSLVEGVSNGLVAIKSSRLLECRCWTRVPLPARQAAEEAGEELQPLCKEMNSTYCCRLKFLLLLCVRHHGLT